MKLFLGAVFITLVFSGVCGKVSGRSPILSNELEAGQEHGMAEESNGSTEVATSAPATNQSEFQNNTRTEPPATPQVEAKTPIAREKSTIKIISHCITTETIYTMDNSETPNTGEALSPYTITETTTTCGEPDTPEITRIQATTMNCTTIVTTKLLSPLVENSTTSASEYKHSPKSSTKGQTEVTCNAPEMSSETSISSNTSVSVTTENKTTICTKEGVSTVVRILKTPTNSTREESKTTCTSVEMETKSTKKEKPVTTERPTDNSQASHLDTTEISPQNELKYSTTESPTSTTLGKAMISTLDDLGNLTSFDPTAATTVLFAAVNEDLSTTNEKNLSTIAIPLAPQNEESISALPMAEVNNSSQQNFSTTETSLTTEGTSALTLEALTNSTKSNVSTNEQSNSTTTEAIQSSTMEASTETSQQEDLIISTDQTSLNTEASGVLKDSTTEAPMSSTMDVPITTAEKGLMSSTSNAQGSSTTDVPLTAAQKGLISSTTNALGPSTTGSAKDLPHEDLQATSTDASESPSTQKFQFTASEFPITSTMWTQESSATATQQTLITVALQTSTIKTTQSSYSETTETTTNEIPKQSPTEGQQTTISTKTSTAGSEKNISAPHNNNSSPSEYNWVYLIFFALCTSLITALIVGMIRWTFLRRSHQCSYRIRYNRN